MDVTAKYELIGLMAYPIRHSLSPEMQNKAAEFTIQVQQKKKYSSTRI